MYMCVCVCVCIYIWLLEIKTTKLIHLKEIETINNFIVL